MVKKNRYILLIILLISLYGCQDLDWSGFFSSPSDVADQRFKQSMQWNSVHPKVALEYETSSYSFLVCGDTHVQNTHTNWSLFINKLRNDSTKKFAIVVGDLSNGKGYLQRFYDYMVFDPSTQQSNDTIFVTSGNHDLFFNDWNLYRKLFGTSVYSFTVKSLHAIDLFISMDNSGGTLGKKQRQWFEKFLKENRNKYRHCIVYNHVNLFDTDGSQYSTGNMSLEETAWLQNVLSKNHVDVYITGHDHHREQFKFGGVEYLVLDAIKDDFKNPTYLSVEMGNTIQLSFIPLEN